MSETTKSRLRNWARWVHWCNAPRSSYICPLGRIVKSEPGANHETPEPSYDEPDAEQINSQVLLLPPGQQAVVLAHYTIPGSAVRRAHRMGLGIASYWRLLERGEKQISEYETNSETVDCN